MHIAIRHTLQVFDPADPSLREDAAIVLPIRDAQAVMGETVAAYLDRVAWRFDLPTICRINGEFYGRAEWAVRALAVNDNVEFVSRPLGSGSGGSTIKSIASVVALVALTAVAGPAGTAAAGSVLFGGGAATGALASLFSAAIVGAGALAISYFLSPKAGGKSASTEALYSFGFQGNQARPMQPIPVLNGRIRFAPDYAAPTYSEYDGDSMIDYALFALTCGRMRMEQVLIGDTPIWDYQTGPNPDFPGIGLQFVEPGEQVTLYPVNVVTAEELSGSELSTTFTPGYIVNAAGTLARELLLDFVWPGGAYHTSKDKILRADTHILVRVRTVDAAGAPTGDWQEIFGKIYSNTKQSQIRITERLTVAPDRYEVSVRRVNEPTASDNGTDAVTWTALRAHIDGPQSFPGVSILAVRGAASKQLSGISGGQLRVIGTRILPVWRDGQFVEEPTRSIAWAALDWWCNGDYAAGLSLTDTDFQAFVAYDALWTALGHTFDHRFTEVQNLDDVLETVLKAGRAFPSPVGDKLTITRDQPRGLSRMLFTENDIVRDSLEIDYALSDEAWADGMVGEYVDQTTWRLAEVSSAPDGVQLLKPARVQLEGVVDRKQAAGMIRFMAAESQYRRITVSWIARMEGRLLKRGDLVKITAEEPETWGESCEIVGVASGGFALTLDPPPVWEAAGNHYVEIRRRDGRPWGPVRVSRGANDSIVIVNQTDAASAASQQGMSLADAVARSDIQERPWLAFSPGQPRTLPVLITEGDPDQDGEHIHLTGVIDASEVYTTSEDGVPPLLQIPDLFSSALPAIIGLNASISQRQLVLILSAGWQAAKNAVSYVADVSYDGGSEWIRAYEGDRTTFEATVGGSAAMQVRVAGVTPAGVRGAFYVIDVTSPDLRIDGELIGIINLPPIDYAGLTEDVRERLDEIQGIVAKADAIVSQAQQDYAAAQARADEIEADAKVAYEDAKGRAQTALDRALESLGASAANATAILDEATTRETADELQVQRTTALIAQTDQDRALVLAEQTARINADEFFSSAFEVVSANIGANAADILSERTARVTADSAQATRLDGLDVAFAGNTAAIVAESTARAHDSEVFSNAFTIVRGQIGDNSAAIADERTARISDSSVFSSAFQSVTAKIGQNTADIISERTARIDADTTQATRIDGISVKADNAAAAVIAETNARISDSTVFSNAFSDVRASLGANSAAITAETQARVSDSGVFSGAFQVVTARIAGAEASIASETQARISDSGVFSSAFQGVFGRLGTNEAAIADERTARIHDSAVFSGAFTDVFARTDAGTASGRFSLVAQSGPAGVSARIQALVAVQSGGQTRGAGYYVEVRDDGTSRFVLDADAFYITKNGSSVPLLSFDGFTLRVPNLVLTAPNVPTGVANVPARFDAANYVLIAQAGQVFEAVDANMVTTINVDNNVYPTVVSLFGTMTLDPQTNMSAMYIRIDGKKVTPIIITGTSGVIGLAAGTQGAAQTFTFSATAVVFLGSGSHEARFQYNYSGGSTSKVTINEIHLAATTPRA